MTGIVKVILAIVALVDGDYSLDAHAKDIIDNAQRLFAPDEVTVEKVELTASEGADLPTARRKTRK
jgi:hypothetical protein